MNANGHSTDVFEMFTRGHGRYRCPVTRNPLLSVDLHLPHKIDLNLALTAICFFPFHTQLV